MVKPLLATLPQELIIRVLECVCELIIKDLTTLTFKPAQRLGYGRSLKQFRELNLVSNSFHDLLAYSIRVDGQLVKKTLLDLQMQKFTTYLELAYILGRTAVSDLHKIFGPVWRNPAFINIVPELLGGNTWITPEAAIYFLFQLRKFLDKDQVDTERNRDQDASIFSSSAIINAEDEHDDKDICTLGDDFDFNHLVSNQTYHMHTKDCSNLPRGVEFVVGKYKFPLQLAVHIPKVWMTGTLIGTSILSFRDSLYVRWSRKQQIYQDRIREWNEGCYWLWFIPNQAYIFIDCRNLIAEVSNGSCREPTKFDLSKYGEEIRH